MDYNKVLSLVYSTKGIVFSKSKLVNIEKKNSYDFVTEVDTEISDFLKKELNLLYPDIGFMTEEEKEHTLSSKTFILDPIDGTTNLIYDYRMSSVSLAYAEDNEIIFGIVFNPFTEEMFFAIKGNGSYCYSTKNGIDDLIKTGIEKYLYNPLSCSKRQINQSLIEFGTCSSRKEMAEETFSRASRVFQNCLDFRRICSSALAICYIAAARLDGYFEKIIKPWDYAAAVLILSEAGGKSSDWSGFKLPLDKSSTIICTNSVIHDDLIQLL